MASSTDEIIVAELTSRLNRWVEGAPGRNWSSLGRQARVHEQVIRRLINQGSIPQTDNLISILKAISSVRYLRDLKFHYSAEMIDYLKSRLPLAEFEEEYSQHESRGDYEELIFTNPEIFLLYFYILACESVTVQQLRDDFGPKVEVRLEQLYSLGKIMENNDGSISPLRQVSSIAGTNKQVLKALILMMTDKSIMADENANCISALSGSVDAETYVEVIGLTEQFLGHIQSMMMEKPGKIPVFMGVVFDSLSRSLKGELGARLGAGTPAAGQEVSLQ